MEIADILYNNYGIYAYLFCAVLGTLAACEFIKLQNKRNMIFYFFANVLYALLLSYLGFAPIVKIIAALVWGYFMVYLHDVGFPLVLYLRQSNFIRKYKYFWGLMCFFAIYVLLNFPESIHMWVAPWYGADYSMGMGSRFFVGAFLHLFFPDFVPAGAAFWFCIISHLCTAAVISFCFDALIKKTDAEYRDAVFFMILLYIASPFCINSYLAPPNFGRLEIHTLFLMVLSVIIFFGIQNNWIKYFLITLLTCLSSAIYQGYIFLYYPMILATMAVSILDMKKIEIKTFIGPVFNVFSTALSFVYFQFFSYVKFDNVEDFTAALKKMTDLEFYEDAIDYELFHSLRYTYDELMFPYLTVHFARERFIMALFVFLPVIILFYHLYKMAWTYKIRDKWYKNEYLYCLLFNFAILPQFFLNIDWGRWLIATGTMMFFDVFLLVYMGNQGMINTLTKLNHFVKKRYFFCIALIIYFAKQQALTAEVILPNVSLLWSNLFLSIFS